MAWPVGLDEIYAVANPLYVDGGRAILESAYDNNTGSTTALVVTGTDLADLMVSGGDFGTSLGYIAGQPVSLDIKVSNLGSVNAGPFVVVVSDGAGGNGPVISTSQVAGLAAGKSTTVQVSNWVPLEGPHVLTATADPSYSVPDSNLSNNTGVIFLTIGQAQKPDLEVSAGDLMLTPASPVAAGTQLELLSVIHNLGTPVANAPVQIVLDEGLPSQVTLASTVIVPTVGTGAAITLVTPIDTSRLSGSSTATHAIVVQLDPHNAITEYDKSNNSASIPLVVNGAVASVAVSADHASYPANTAASFQVTLQSLGINSGDYLFNAGIETGTGLPVASIVSGWTEPLGSGVAVTVPLTWGTGSTVAGSYQLVASLTDPVSGLVVASGSRSFAISPTVGTLLNSEPLATSYPPGATAVVVTRVVNQSSNAALDNVNLVVNIKTPAGGSFFSSTREHLSVSFNQDLKLLDSVGIPASVGAGNYPIIATLTDSGGHTLATGSGQLVVQPATIPSELVASLSATPSAFAPGASVTLSATLTNQTVGTLTNQAVVIEVANPTTHAVVASFSSSQTLSAGKGVTLSDTWGTGALPAGEYLAAVTVNGTALAHEILHCDTAGQVPPLIVISGVRNGELTNHSVTPVISITAPSGTFTSNAALDGRAFNSGTIVGAAGTHFLLVNATDSKGNSASATVAFTLYFTAPTVIVGGLPNGNYTNAAAVTPTVTVLDPYLDPAQTLLQLNGAPFYLKCQISAEGSATLTVSATDRAGNNTHTSASFVIDRTPPTIVFSGITNSEITKAASVQPVASITDLHLDNSKTSLTLNGAPFISGNLVTAENSYTLAASATDLAGNRASLSWQFALDRTPPTLTVTGVINNQTSAGPVSISYSASDPHLKSVSATLDGSGLASGTTVTASGTHTLVVSALDQAGNSASQTLTFSIKAPSTLPVFSPGVCAASVTLTDNATVAAGLPSGPAISPSAIVVNSSGPLNEQVSATLRGSALVQGNLSLSDNSSLTGTAKVGGTESVGNQASLGAVVLSKGFQSPCCPFNVASAVAAAATDNDNAKLPSAIRSLISDGGVFAISSGSASFPSGAYAFNSFTVSKTAQVGVASGATVQLYVKGAVTVQDQALLAGDPQRLTSLSVLASGNLTLSSGQVGITADGGGVSIVGDYAVPGLFYSGGAVTVSQSTQVVGGIMGQSVAVSNNASVFVPLSLIPTDGGVTCH